VSAYDVLKPTVVTESDVNVRKCVIGDENDVTRSHDTLIDNVEVVTDDKDAQIEFKACNANNMSDDDPVSLDPVSRDVCDEHDVLCDEQRADPTLERAWVWAQKNKNNFFVKDELCTIVTKFYSKMCSKFAYRQRVGMKCVD